MAKKAAGPKAPAKPPVQPVILSAGFCLVFFSVLLLSLLSLGVALYLVQLDHPSEEAKRLAETCSTTWKLGFGAVVGLIGGKAL